MLNPVRRNRSLFFLFAGLLVLACVSNPRPVSLAVRPVEDTVMLQRQSDKTSFKVTAVLRNLDSRPLQVLHCGTEAQRQIEGRWVTVFVPVCALDASSRLAPGDSLVIPVEVFGFSAQNASPHLDPRMTSGRYRLRFGIGIGDFSLAGHSSLISPIASSPFTVMD